MVLCRTIYKYPLSSLALHFWCFLTSFSRISYFVVAFAFQLIQSIIEVNKKAAFCYGRFY